MGTAKLQYAASAKTTVKCEGCGRRLTERELYWPDNFIPVLMGQGECFRWSFDYANRVVINLVYSTVCSPECLEKAAPRKAEYLRKTLQAQADEELRPYAIWQTKSRKPRRSSSKFTRVIKAACGTTPARTKKGTPA